MLGCVCKFLKSVIRQNEGKLMISSGKQHLTALINVDSIGLLDAVVGLKTIIGMDTIGLVRSDYATSGADVNGDNRVGIAEVLYVLMKTIGRSKIEVLP